MNPEQLTKNSFVDKMLKLIPEDPLTQAHYMYLLTLIVFLGLLGYGAVSWYQFVTTLNVKMLFSGLFMTAVALISAFGLKQTRNNYKMIKQIYSQPKQEMKIESVDDMLKAFK